MCAMPVALEVRWFLERVLYICSHICRLHRAGVAGDHLPFLAHQELDEVPADVVTSHRFIKQARFRAKVRLCRRAVFLKETESTF